MRAGRRDRWTSPLFLGVLAVIVFAVAAAVTVAVLDDDGETVAGDTTSTSATTSSTASSTTAPAAATVPEGWYVVIQSGRDTEVTAAQLEPAVEEFGERGHVLDTDDYVTGNGRGPDFYPNPGAIAAVVGPFPSHDEAAGFCGGGGDDDDEDDDEEDAAPSCPVRQLVARSG